MMIRPLSIAALLLCAAAGCSGADSANASDPTSSGEAETAAAASPVEDVKQYNDCLNDGHGGDVNLHKLNADSDPGTRAIFDTADCVVGRLTQFKKKFRPYNIQSFKNTAQGQTFIFKRVSDNVIGEAPSECLKIKLSVAVGPTDASVSIDRVKQLPPVSGAALCSDNGET